MKKHALTKTASACLAAIVLMAAGTATTVSAALLPHQLLFRPLTPQEVKDYTLGSAQLASGLSSVGVGQPAYLEALVDLRIGGATITNVIWTLTKPGNSAAALETSPLGTNVPPFSMRDRLDYRVGARTLLRPDVAGQYTVAVALQTMTNGTINLSQKITAGTYMGVSVCSVCHSGSTNISNIFPSYANTKHAVAFAEAIDGKSTDHFQARCTSCHVVGFDTNALAVNGGFDDIAKQLNWQFPTNFTNGTFAAMPAELRNLANIQCESCHGPGSEHAYAFGNTNLANWPRISTSMAAGSCAQCHDSLTHHYKTAEWKNSRHAIATRSPSGAGREFCVRCHTAPGYKNFMDTGIEKGWDLTYQEITCQTCHDPHDATNPKQVRATPIYTLPEGTTVTNAGLGAVCMTCHHSRNGGASNNVAQYMLNAPTWAGGVSFGPHDSTAGEMIEGVGGIEYGKPMPSGTHNVAISNMCVGCHMQEVPSTSPAFTKAGGHTFAMGYNVVTNGVTNHVALTEVCAKCHGHLHDFDMVRKDYNGDGVIDGIQTEVQKLLDRLSTLLPNSTYQSDPSKYVADGLVKSIGRTSMKTNWPVRFLNAAWNHMFVNVEGSHGIHNAPYAVALLKASIADLTDDSNNDRLPDTWQIQYFGSTTASNAAPNFSAAGDGVPNWLKWSLGLNPLVAGLVVPDGVVWADGKVVGGNTTNTALKIYTAAEVAFPTEVGKTYQIQAVSALGEGWRNIGPAIPGTGSTNSYVTPTRTKVQQYYRVEVK